MEDFCNLAWEKFEVQMVTNTEYFIRMSSDIY